MLHVITGNGKGKTTAAIGMAVRAIGAGMNVYFAQFVKQMPYSEHHILESLPRITLKILGRDCFIYHKPSNEDINTAIEAWKTIVSDVATNKFDLIILDELHIALYYELLNILNVTDWINANKTNLEIVTTGRYAPQELINIGDLVSEIKEIKHYFTKNIEARKGIEY